MCTVGDDTFEMGNYMSGKGNVSLSATCNKCRTGNPSIVLRSKDVYCVSCFQASTIHKFKALLGKHRLLRPNDRVLIYHKTGHPSTALLHFLRTGLDLNTPKKLRFQPVILFVENNLHLSKELREKISRSIKTEVQQFNFELHFIKFGDYVGNCENLNEALTKNLDALNLDDEDKNVFDNMKLNESELKDVKNIMERNLLIDVAKHLDCKYVFTPDLSVDVAVQLLTNISLGRGPHIPLDIGFCDDRDEEIKILRPLRLFEIKELAFYNIFNNLEPVSVPHSTENPYSSVQNTMKKFVTGLQMNYPATVTTILRTGDKLTLDDSNNKKCNICKGPIIQTNDKICSAESTSFSHWVSTRPSNTSISRSEKYEQLANSYMKQSSDYCYSCTKIANVFNTIL